MNCTSYKYNRTMSYIKIRICVNHIVLIIISGYVKKEVKTESVLPLIYPYYVIKPLV